MPIENKSRNRVRDLVAILVTSLVMIGGYLVFWSTPVQDWLSGITYDEPATISEIRRDIALTSTGERIFLATHPSIESAESFNEHCDSHREEVSLLGCYVGDRIYIYEITLDELKDSNKVTAAHELLHAIWDRLSEGERAKVKSLLAEIEADSPAWVEVELDLYEGEDERTEELYTRVATKLREIPAELETHYRGYFQERSKLVDYYDAFQAPFNKLQGECAELRLRISHLGEQIDQGRSEYEVGTDAFDQRVEDFNRCANTAGCFRSQAEFNSQRAALEAERVRLNELRESVNALIDENNAKVTEYQEKQRALGQLNDALNSNIEKLERSNNE